MRWQAIQGWLTEQEGWVLRRLAQEVPRGGLIVEVGAWKGRSTVALGQGAEGKEVVTIDHFRSDSDERQDADLPNLRDVLIYNLARCGLMGQVEVIEGESVEVAARWHEPIDLLFLDGSHDYESVKADIEAWWPHLKPEGIVVFHDYTDFPGVRQAVDEQGFRGHQVLNTSFFVAYKSVRR